MESGDFLKILVMVGVDPYGLGYLFNVGLPSLISALNQREIHGEPRGVTTHEFQWFEMSANRHAARCFGRYYGVDWNRSYKDFTIEKFYPRIRR